MAFRTKLDFSNNRQVKQHIETLTVLSGGTSFGVPFNTLPTGIDITTSAQTASYAGVGSTFSGNSGTTIFSWGYSDMALGYPTLSAITPSNSATTQYTSGYTGTTVVTIDDNLITTAYSGVSFDVKCISIYNLGGGNYTGTVATTNLVYFSASTLGFTGRTIWVDVSGYTRTQDLILTKNPVIGATFTCIDNEGKGSWISASASTYGIWVAGTGLNSARLNGSSSLALGNYSVAEGVLTLASGIGSHAEGSGTTASGNYSHAEGYRSLASGQGSHAEGGTSSGGGTLTGGTASGRSSHAEGQQTLASGDNSHAEGDTTLASGTGSHAEGSGTTASANYSHAEGYKSKASGQGSHAEGYSSLAFGDGSHAEGGYLAGLITGGTAYGYASHAEGVGTLAFGNASHAEGGGTIANGYASHAEGSGTLAQGFYSHAEGVKSLASGYGSHAEGGISGSTTGGTASGDASHAEGARTLASGDYSHAEGSGTTASGDYSHAEGSGTNAIGDGSHAEGFGTNAIGDGSHAEGVRTSATSWSHAEGWQCSAIGGGAHAEGYNTIASNAAAHSQGVNTIASGNTSHAMGQACIAGANNTFAGGQNSETYAHNSFVFGSSSLILSAATYSNVLGRNVTGTTQDTTYVDYLNVKRVLATASANDIRIDANGNLTTNVSDERLKENITPLIGSLDKIKAIQGVTYQWKDRNAGTDAIKLGFIAQQVESVEPLLVFTNKGEDEYKGLHIDGIIPLLVEAVKELASGGTSNNYLQTQTILAEDNNIELNYSGTPTTALGGGLTVLHGMGVDLSSELIIDADGNWITNNDFIPNKITLPAYTPSGSTDTNGNLGNVTRDDDYLYMKISDNKWKRIKLEEF